jgi:3-oxoacyl-[acyl-carrier-protein] synthase-3
MYVNIDRLGNTSSASIPIALDELVRAGRIRPGDHVGFSAFGGGATWGGSVMRWTAAVPLADPEAVPAAEAEGAAS